MKTPNAAFALTRPSQMMNPQSAHVLRNLSSFEKEVTDYIGDVVSPASLAI